MENITTILLIMQWKSLLSVHLMIFKLADTILIIMVIKLLTIILLTVITITQIPKSILLKMTAIVIATSKIMMIEIAQF